MDIVKIKKKHGHSHGENKKNHSEGHSHSQEGEHDHKSDSSSEDIEHNKEHNEDDNHSFKEKQKEHSEDSSDQPVVLKKARNDNMYAVYLHVIGDFLGSLAAIASGLLINFLTFDQRYYFDPILSLVIVLLILKTCIPLVKKCIHIFMQDVPTFLNPEKLRTDLQKVPGVISVHELHVWTLVGNKSIGTVHISCLDNADFMNIAHQLKTIFHKHNIHSTTIQPEFLQTQVLKKKRERCQLGCLKEETCKTESCCPPTYDDALGDAELLSLIQETKPRKRKTKDNFDL